MPISLPQELDRKIEKQLKVGNYASKSEYVRRAVRETLVWEAGIAKHERRAINAGLMAVKKKQFSRAFKNSREAVKYLRGL